MQEEQKKKELTMCYDDLCGMALSLTKDPSKSKDLLHDAYEKAFKNLEKYTLGSNACGWMYNTLKNLFIDSTRKKSNKVTDHYGDFTETQLGTEYSQEDKTINKEREENIKTLVLSAIELLPDHLREVLILQYTTKLTIDDIASRIPCSKNEVICRSARAKEYLREEILKKDFKDEIQALDVKLNTSYEDERYNFGLFAAL